MADRIHKFEAIENVRDYGDYAGHAGRRLKPGRLLRTGHHARATDADLRRLQDMEVAVVVDLRHPAERVYQPSRRLPGWTGRAIESDIDNDEQGEPPHITFLKSNDLSAENVHRYMMDAYRRIPFEARHLDLFSRYFDALSETEGAVLIHCAAGKDRTGLLAALTHRLTGVSEDDLIEDYLLTNTAVDLEGRAPEIAKTIETNFGRKASAAAVQAFLGVRPEFLAEAFRVIDDQYGSLDSYLERACGVDPAKRDRLAERLLA
ncbi:MAG: tyrosine-protein phosphatase [Caulobacteraceae bacterium]|nr:tyrosine-protein phosphatase [Caulobacteraceae bacterium]